MTIMSKKHIEALKKALPKKNEFLTDFTLNNDDGAIVSIKKRKLFSRCCQKNQEAVYECRFLPPEDDNDTGCLEARKLQGPYGIAGIWGEPKQVFQEIVRSLR